MQWQWETIFFKTFGNKLFSVLFDYQVQCSDVTNTEDPSILIKGDGNYMMDMALIPIYM